MAEAVVTVALETIRDLLIDEGKYLFGVRDQVEELQGELEALQSFLKDAIVRTHENKSVRTWVSQAKRLAYRAEDIIEEYATKVGSKRGGGFRKVARRAAGIVGEGIAIHKVGKQLDKINTEIASLIKRLESYGINRIIEAQPSSATIDKQRRLRTTYAHEVDEYFVGMEDDVSKIVTWVAEDDKIRRVITVCGIGGLGKTTIARKVFNHIKTSSERSFKCFAWVSVTEQCQVKMLLHNILIQIRGDKGRDTVRDMEEVDLVPKLYDVLKNKKCFVVLDDIWKLDDWESLRPAFPISEGSSKILLTTRKREVAEVAHPHSQHELKLLDEKNGWNLLTKISFNLQEDQGNTLPETVKNVGRDMLHKCGGLPLAISALGGILRNKDPLTEWETVNNKFETYLRRDDGVVDVLALSYDDLPSYLRPCFLYMGCFGEDEDIDVMHLYQLWMAEGLIPSCKQGPEETLMDVASDFLDELISRNMVQAQVRDVLTNEKFCRLHDLVRVLCLTKGKEENFLEVENKQLENGEAWVVSYDRFKSCRHAMLVVNRYRCKILMEKPSHDTYLRALMIKVLENPMLELCRFNFKGPRFNLKRLRSLVLDNCSFDGNKLPREIKDMIHLRLLSLRNCLGVRKLPSFIGDLKYLQTLNVCTRWIQLPNIFYKMRSLRCLYLSSFRDQPWYAKKLEFHGLNQLEVLEGLNSKYDQFTLSEFITIRRFSATIWGYEKLSAIMAHLSPLLKVQHVSFVFRATGESGSQLAENFPDVQKLVMCRCLHNLELYAPIGKLPRYGHQLWPDLVTLKLINTKFEEDPMPFLQELPNLRELIMEYDAYVGKGMYCSSTAFVKLTYLRIYGFPNIQIWRVDAGAFPKLTSLQFSDLPKIKTWRVDAGAFPNLSTLSIWECRSFEKIVPDGLTSITTLTRIHMFGVPDEFKNRYKRLQIVSRIH